MSPVDGANSLIIETRRAARARTESRKNDKVINKLDIHLESRARGDDSARDQRRPQSLYRSGAEQDVPFRHSIRTPRLNAAFVAQLLGQAMPEQAAQSSGALAAYKQTRAPALTCDRRL